MFFYRIRLRRARSSLNSMKFIESITSTIKTYKFRYVQRLNLLVCCWLKSIAIAARFCIRPKTNLWVNPQYIFIVLQKKNSMLLLQRSYVMFLKPLYVGFPPFLGHSKFTLKMGRSQFTIKKRLLHTHKNRA